MRIYESEILLDQDILKQKRSELQAAFPDLIFDRSNRLGNYLIVNHIPGYKGWEADGMIRIQVFPNVNVAVVDDEMPPETSDKIRSLGYRVPEKRVHRRKETEYELTPGTTDDFVRVGEYDIAVTADEVLWEELKGGYGHDTIKKKLTRLLTQITSLPSVKEYEFGTYYYYHASSDNSTLYIKCTDLFRLPSDAIVEPLVEKLRTINLHHALGISSRVRTDRGERHIPMIDFADGNPYDALRRICAPEKLLVDSGNSSHHYDTQQLLTQAEFETYMHLLSEQPEVGKVWPNLQLDQGFALLRIAPTAYKPFYPEVVEE